VTDQHPGEPDRQPGQGSEQEATEYAEEVLRQSNPNGTGDEGLAGAMGVSSEREGSTGPDEVGADGMRDTVQERLPGDPDQADDTPPEQSTGNEETNPEGIEPSAGYPSLDPRSD
jgi:hypothetical protein